MSNEYAARPRESSYSVPIVTERSTHCSLLIAAVPLRTQDGLSTQHSALSDSTLLPPLSQPRLEHEDGPEQRLTVAPGEMLPPRGQDGLRIEEALLPQAPLVE